LSWETRANLRAAGHDDKQKGDTTENPIQTTGPKTVKGLTKSGKHGGKPSFTSNEDRKTSTRWGKKKSRSKKM